MHVIRPSGPLLALICATLLWSSLPLHAQTFPEQPLEPGLRSGIGWSVVVPEALLGVGAFHVVERIGWGLFTDVKVTHDSPRRSGNFQSDQTVATVEATFPPVRREMVADWDDWIFLNAGLIRSITPQLGLVLGGGLARKSIIREYLDTSDQRRTPTGFYFVEDDRVSGWETNALVSVLIRSGSLGISAGYEIAPRSVSLGLYWMIQ